MMEVIPGFNPHSVIKLSATLGKSGEDCRGHFSFNPHSVIKLSATRSFFQRAYGVQGVSILTQL